MCYIKRSRRNSNILPRGSGVHLIILFIRFQSFDDFLETNAQTLTAAPKRHSFFSFFTFHKATSAGRPRQPAAGRTGGVRAADNSRQVAAAPGQPRLHFRETKISHSRSRLRQQKSSVDRPKKEKRGKKLQLSAGKTIGTLAPSQPRYPVKS